MYGKEIKHINSPYTFKTMQMKSAPKNKTSFFGICILIYLNISETTYQIND